MTGWSAPARQRRHDDGKKQWSCQGTGKRFRHVLEGTFRGGFRAGRGIHL